MADKTGFEKFVSKSTTSARVAIQGPRRGERVERELPDNIWEGKEGADIVAPEQAQPTQSAAAEQVPQEQQQKKKGGRPRGVGPKPKIFNYYMDEGIRESLERIKQRRHAQSIASLVTMALVEFIERNEG